MHPPYNTRLLPFKTQEVIKMKVCTAHDTPCSEVCRAEALLGIFFVSTFHAFLSETLLWLFCKHFFPHFSLSDKSAESVESSKLRKSAEIHKIWSTEKNLQMRKNLQNPHPWVCDSFYRKILHARFLFLQTWCDHETKIFLLSSSPEIWTRTESPTVTELSVENCTGLLGNSLREKKWDKYNETFSSHLILEMTNLSTLNFGVLSSINKKKN